jgi:hypothetical protein
MRARLQRRGHRIGIALVVNRWEGRYTTSYLGWLGQIASPASPEDHATFWSKLDQRLKDIAARDARVTPEQIEKVRASIKARLPPPMKAEVRKATAKPWLSRETKQKRGVSVTTA